MRHIQISLKRIRLIVDNIAPCKTKGVKVNTQKWCDAEFLENKNTTDKLFKILKSLGIPKKTLISNFNAVESNNTLTFD